MKKSGLLTSPGFYIGLLLTAVAVFTFLRSYWREPVMDEILYGFVLHTDTYAGYWGDGQLTERITTLGDIASSMVNHYIYGNGRIPVHIVEQLFTGIIGLDVYSVLNGLLLAGLIVMTIWFSVEPSRRRNVMLWLLTAIAVMYMFPYTHRLWYSINYSCNYLLPSLLMLTVLFMFRRVESGRPLRWWQMVIFGITGFVFGWSHEGFSYPVLGGLGIYYLLNFKRLLKGGWCLAVPLFIGCVVILLSPANWSRMGGRLSLFTNFFITAYYITRMPMFWGALVALGIAKWAGGVKLKPYFKAHWVLVVILGIQYVMFLYIGAWSYAYTPMALVMLMISLGLLSRMQWTAANTRTQAIVASVLGIVFLISQISIAVNTKVQYDCQHDLISRYHESTDGIMPYNPPTVPWYSRPWVTVWPVVSDYFSESILIRAAHSAYRKPFVPLYPEEMAYVNSPAQNDDFQEVGRWYWVDSARVAPGQQFEVEYHPVSIHDDAPFFLPIKFALTPGAYPSTGAPEMDTIRVGGRSFLCIRKPEIRRIKAIHAK